MSGVTFAIAFMLGSGMIALWVNVRFPRLCPQELRRAFLHLVGGVIVLDVMTRVGAHLTPDMGSFAATRITEVFVFTLPSLTYFLVAVTWMIRATQGLMAGRFR